MSETQALQTNFQTALKPRNLRIQTSLYDSQNDNGELPVPPSQIWYQFSQTNIKTPVSQKFPAKNTSQYLQFSNNLYQRAGPSEFVTSSEHENSRKQSTGQGEKQVGNKQKQIRKQKLQFISELSITQNEKNQILGKNNDFVKENQQEEDKYGVKQSRSNQRSSYEERDLNGKKREFILDKVKKQEKKEKQPQMCAGCLIM